MTMKRKFAAPALASAAAFAALAGPAQADTRQSRPTVTYELTVEVTNLAPSGDTLQNPRLGGRPRWKLRHL
ncbi:MAG: hypothetical protein ACI8Y4_002201 [Candidatus Poriferisodalaceae bacterium]|jgi:hypothetical protein